MFQTDILGVSGYLHNGKFVQAQFGSIVDAQSYHMTGVDYLSVQHRGSHCGLVQGSSQYPRTGHQSETPL